MKSTQSCAAARSTFVEGGERLLRAVGAMVARVSRTMRAVLANRFRWLNTARYALADLVHDPGPALLCVGATAVAALDVWLVGGVAESVYRSRERAFEETVPTELTIRPYDPMDVSARFGVADLRALMQHDDVRAAYPLVEVRVRAALGDRPFGDELVVARGRRLDAERTGRAVVLGAGLRTANDLVLPRAVFEWLGGNVGPPEIEPKSVRIELERSVDGIEQREEVELTIAGLVGDDHDERLDVALELADAIDRWTAGEDVPGWTTRPTVRAAAPRAWVTVAPDSWARFEAELTDLELERAANEHESGAVRSCIVERADGGRLEPSDHIALELLQPIVTAVEPLWMDRVAFGSRPAIPFRARPSTDVALAGLERSVVLPWSMLSELCAGGQLPDGVLGASFASADGRQCTVPLRVCGWTSDSSAVVSTWLASELAAWRAGRLEWDDERGAFERPAPPEHRWVRASVFATDVDAIQPLASALTQQGWHVSHRLAEFEALQRFGSVLTQATILLVAGCLIVAAIAVLGTCAQRIYQRAGEIRLLWTLGIGPGQIRAVYGVQASALGLSSFALAAVSQAWLSGPVNQELSAALGTGAPASDGGAAWLGIVLLLGCLAGPALGMIWTAWRKAGR